MDRDPANSHSLSNWPGPLAFVFSGGAAYGATQVGMLKALLEAGIAPDMVVGTSVGALNGTRFAADPSGAVDDLTEVWGSMSSKGVFGGKTKVGAAFNAARNGLRNNNAALCSPNALRSLIDTRISAENLEDLTTPTAIVVTDAQIGQPKLLTRGKVGPALQASSALPGVFPPVKIDGCFYVDGGVSANVPIRQAIAFGAKSVVVLDATPVSMPGTVPTSVINSVLHASMIMLRNQRADAVEELMGRYPILQIPRVTPSTQSSFDFKNSAQLIEIGYSNTQVFLEQLPGLTDASRRHSMGPDTPSPAAQGTEQPEDEAQAAHSASKPPPPSRLKL